jgi:hypothetical protein
MPDQVTQAELRAVLDDEAETGRHKRADKIRARIRKGATVEPGELRAIFDLGSFTVTSEPITKEVANA